MSEIDEHSDDAWFDLLFMDDRYEDEGYEDGAYRRKTQRYGLDSQPEYHQFNVEAIHAETEKSWLVSGTVHFDPEYSGFRKFNFDKIWLPKSRCDACGNHIRVPHWLVAKRIELATDPDKVRRAQENKFPGIVRKANEIVNAQNFVPPWQGSQ